VPKPGGKFCRAKGSKLAFMTRQILPLPDTRGEIKMNGFYNFPDGESGMPCAAFFDGLIFDGLIRESI
jgi:hypothetical protein